MASKPSVGDRVNIKAGDERGGWGTVVLIANGEYHVSLYGGSDHRIYDRDEISKPRTMKPGDGRATKAVFFNLHKEVKYMVSAWQSFLGKDTPKDEFVKGAQRWLKDNTNLKTRTIECANWQEVYDYFLTQLPKEEKAAKPEADDEVCVSCGCSENEFDPDCTCQFPYCPARCHQG